MTRDAFQTLLRFFKAMAHESRLRMVGLLAERELSVSELAAALELRDPTVSHHLSVLRELGLVEVRVDGNHRLYRLEPDVLEAMTKQVLAPGATEVLSTGVDADAWRGKVLDAFVEGERLVSIPASRKKREVILEWLVERVPPGRDLTEIEISEILGRHHEDVATLRRELVGAGLVRRDRGIYRRE